MTDENTPRWEHITGDQIEVGMNIRLSEEKLRNLKLVRGTTEDSWYVDDVIEGEGERYVVVIHKDRGSHFLRYLPNEELLAQPALPEQGTPPDA